MIWLHKKVFRHQTRRTTYPAVWVHGGQRPKRVLITCSCKKSWVRR